MLRNCAFYILNQGCYYNEKICVFESEEETFAPAVSDFSFASDRDILDSSPVKTIVFSMNKRYIVIRFLYLLL